MLAVLETRIAAAVARALPGVAMVAGPSTAPAAPQDERVDVSGTLLEVVPPRDDDGAAARGPSFLLDRQRWPGDGSTRDFTAAVDGEVIEVEAPAGFPLRRGDDYTVDGRTVRCYVAPARGIEIVATFRGAPARGFQELRPARLHLVLTVWAGGRERADELLGRVLDAVLAASASLGDLEAAHHHEVRRRLLRPTMALAAIERTAATVGDRGCFKAAVALVVCGELEITVALGAAERPRTIDAIDYRGVTLR